MADKRITRIPLTITVTATGQETDGYLCAVAVTDLDALEMRMDRIKGVLDNADLTSDEAVEAALHLFNREDD